MAFIDDTAKTAKDTFNMAMKLADKAISAGKARTEALSLKVKLAADYEKLGRLAYPALKEAENSPEITALCDVITDKENTLRELSEYIHKNDNKE